MYEVYLVTPLEFFVVILSVAFQGSTLGIVARWLNLTSPARPRPLYNLELVTMAKSDMDLIVVDIPGASGESRGLISDLPCRPVRSSP